MFHPDSITCLFKLGSTYGVATESAGCATDGYEEGCEEVASACRRLLFLKALGERLLKTGKSTDVHGSSFVGGQRASLQRC